MGSAARSAKWQEAIAAHRRALDSFVATASGLPAAVWDAPYAEGKWTRAEVAEHVRLVYTKAYAEVTGGQGMRVRTAWPKRTLLRLLVMPWILRNRRMPKGAPAVREIRPADGPYDQAATVAGVRAEGERFLGALDKVDLERFAGVSHPFFGRMEPLQGIQLLTVHTEHHEAQLAGRARS
jgi:hypothetical protein